VTRLQNRLGLTLHTALNHKRQTFTWLERRLQHPGQRLRNQAQRLDELEQRMRYAQRSAYRHAGSHLAELWAKLQLHTPIHKLKHLNIVRENLARRMHSGFSHKSDKARGRLELLARALDAVSPLATLGRGYAIIRRLPDQKLVRSIRDVVPGADIEARLAHGSLLCKVTKTHHE
jgi:exodeoxyribonuclease VII large subunit